jgi:hypothetical protein
MQETALTRDKLILGIATVFGILISLGALFRVMRWPGASVMWWGALGILTFVFLPIYFFTGIRNPDSKVNTIVSSILILGGVGILFLLTNLRQSQWMQAVYLSSNTYVKQAYAYTSTQNTQRYAVAKNDSLKLIALKQASDKLCNTINSLKTHVMAWDNAEAPLLTEEEFVMKHQGNYDIPTRILFGDDATADAELVALKTDIQKFNLLVKQTNTSADVSLLNVADESDVIEGNTIATSWENANFYHAPFEMVMRNLTQLQLNVRLIESSCIN